MVVMDSGSVPVQLRRISAWSHQSYWVWLTEDDPGNFDGHPSLLIVYFSLDHWSGRDEAAHDDFAPR